MALFRKQDLSHGTAIKAAAGVASGQIGSFLGYQVGTAEERALSIPSIARSRSMIAGIIAGLDLKLYTRQWTGEEYEKIYVPSPAWMDRPDPKVTRQFIIAQTVSDLLMYGRAWWYITARDGNTGLPVSFTWLPAANVSTPNQQGPQFFGMPDEVEFNGVLLPLENTVCFLAADQGLIYTGSRSIDIAIRLDAAARRFAMTEIAAGYLQQSEGSEPMDSESLSELASAWASARRESAIGALNSAVKFVEFSSDPAKLQLTEARNYAALEMSRIAGVPAYLLSAPVSSGMTYSNAQQARQDLWLWGAAPYAKTIAETLSSPQILGPGRYCEFDADEFLEISEMVSSDEPRTEDSPSAPLRQDQTA
jgi:phage portal protein BeeE